MLLKPSRYIVTVPTEQGVTLCNTLTKSIIEVTSSSANTVFAVLKSPNERAENFCETIEILRRTGFLVETGYDELAWLESQYRRQEEATSNALFVTLIPTMKCNLACGYCSQEFMPFEITEDGTNVLLKFLISELRNKGRLYLTFFGGEPLIRPAFVNRVCTELNNLADAESKKVEFMMVTNGVLLDEKVSRNLLLSNRVKVIQVTFDGNQKSHDSRRIPKDGSATFSRILGNVKLMLAVIAEKKLDSVRVMIRVNLFNETLSEIDALLDYFTESEKRHFRIYFRPVFNTDHWKKENADNSRLTEYFALAEAKGFQVSRNMNYGYQYCEGGGGANWLNIMGNLDVWKCSNGNSESVASASTCQCASEAAH